MSIYISTFGEITFDFTEYKKRITEKGIKKFVELFQKETGIEIDEEKEIKFESISGKLVAKTNFSYGGPDAKEFVDESIKNWEKENFLNMQGLQYSLNMIQCLRII